MDTPGSPASLNLEEYNSLRREYTVKSTAEYGIMPARTR